MLKSPLTSILKSSTSVTQSTLYQYVLNFSISFQMDKNPWEVDSIQAFSYLKCPECKFDTKKETLFEKHATKRHPLSHAFFGKNEFIKVEIDSGVQIKEEPKLEKDQGNLLKGIDSKTVRRLQPLLIYVLFLVTHFL